LDLQEYYLLVHCLEGDLEVLDSEDLVLVEAVVLVVLEAVVSAAAVLAEVGSLKICGYFNFSKVFYEIY
jgi:hypothetical protein